MSLTLHSERCKGCGICVEFCPKQVLTVNQFEKVEVIDEQECIVCRQCELRCPDFAIFVHQE